jgi:molybdopterin converting factor small subunit
MSIKVKIAAVLQEDASIPDIVEVSGNTVGECLADLIRQYPEAGNWLSDQDSLLPVLVSINDEETVALNQDGLNRVLNANDELQVFAVIDGG